MEHKKGLGYRLYRKKTIKMAEEKVSLLGVNNDIDAVSLLNIRLILTMFVFIVFLLFSNYGYIVGPIAALLVYFSYFPLYVDKKIEKRARVLEKDSMYFFEILALSLEAGRNIKTALEVTTRNINSELSDEFKKVLKDVSFGKDLTESLEELKHRIPSDTINNIILNIRQSNIFGNNIIDTVYAQISYLREKRVLETKAYISKMPIKISIISVVFFVPLLLLLLLGPMLINLLG